MSARTALVTGANGFIGSHLAEALLVRDWTVRALVRKTSDLRWLPEGIEVAYGEVTDALSLPGAVDGVDVVFHCAGITRAPDEAGYLEVNAGGTRNLTQAARVLRKRPERIVLVSSLAAGGPSRPGQLRDERDPDEPQGFYGRSKKRGEDELVANASGIPWTIIRPPAVYGPRDRAFLVLATYARKGWIPHVARDRQEVTVVHVQDLVRGILAAAESAKTRQRVYYLTHPRVTTWGEVGAVMAGEFGTRARAFPVPGALVPVAGRIAGGLAALGRRPNPLPADRIRDLLAPAWTCSSQRAHADFGFEPEIDLESGIASTVEWFRKEGWV